MGKMRKGTAILLLFLIISIVPVLSISTKTTTANKEKFEEWFKTFEHSFRDLIKTEDGYVGIWSLKNEAYLLKFDKDFNLIWKKKIADGGTYYSVVETDDGFAVGGVFAVEGKEDLIIIKTDKEGNVEWTEMYGSKEKEEILGRMIEIEDGFLLVGHILGFSSPTDRPLIVFKVDESGSLIWNKSFYGDRDKFMWAYGCDAVEVGDGYMISGIFVAPSSPWLIKIDKDGNEIWNKTYDRGAYEATARIIRTSDGNFLVGGWGEGSAYLLKVDEDGNVIWYYSYYGNWVTFRAIAEVEDGYLAVGGTQTNTMGSSDIFFLKVNKSNGGDVIWYRQFGGRDSEGSRGIIVEEGSYIIYGGWAPYPPNGTGKGIVLKTWDYAPPEIEIVRPKENYLYIFDREICPFKETLAIGKITIRVNFTNPENAPLKRMEFYVGKEDEPREIDYSPPYEWTMDFKYWGDIGITCGLYYGDANGVAVDKTSFKVINLKLFS